jgi:hypothetical protein
MPFATAPSQPGGFGNHLLAVCQPTSDKLEPFRRQERGGRTIVTAKQAPGRRGVPFDKRRIHFLKFGQMEQRSGAACRPPPFRMLQDKSRDEIEQGSCRWKGPAAA